MSNLFQETIAVGFIVLIVITIAMAIQEKLYPEKNKYKYYITTFLAGMAIHLICEGTGINKYYCQHGNACVSKA